MKRVLAALAVSILFLSACGDDGGGSSAEVDKVKTSLMDESEDGLALPEDDAECIAEKVVDEFGADRVNEIDFEAETPNFEGDEPAQAADAFDDCLALNEMLVDSFARSSTISDDSASCLTDAIDEADAHVFIEESFTPPGVPSDDSLTKIDEDLSSCLTAEEYEAFAAS